jgi:Arc/MetJ-type ribon-helix-helix transcriptional regulator
VYSRRPCTRRCAHPVRGGDWFSRRTRSRSWWCDAEIESALEQLGDKYGNRSSTLKAGLLALARAERDEQLRRESERLAADPDDLAEMRAVREDLDGLRACRPGGRGVFRVNVGRLDLATGEVSLFADEPAPRLVG